jgi:hypothetical protein
LPQQDPIGFREYRIAIIGGFFIVIGVLRVEAFEELLEEVAGCKAI